MQIAAEAVIDAEIWWTYHPFHSSASVVVSIVTILLALGFCACSSVQNRPWVRALGCGAMVVSGIGLAVYLFAVSNHGLPPLVRKTIGPFKDRSTVGISLSGGGLSGMVDALCFLKGLDLLTDGKFGPSRSKKLVVSTVSGGSLAYASYANLEIVVPELRPNWTVAEMAAWPRPGDLPPGTVPFSRIELINAAQPQLVLNFLKDAVDCAALDQKACARLKVTCTSEGVQSGGAGTTYGPPADLCFISLGMAECLTRSSIWPCMTELLLRGQGIVEPKDMSKGPKTWYVQFSSIDSIAGPYGAGPLPGKAVNLSVAMSAFGGPPNQRNVLSIASNFVPTGFALNGNQPGTPLSSVDLLLAVAFSSDFPNMRSSFLDSSTNANGTSQTCPLAIRTGIGCEEDAMFREAYNLGGSLIGEWDSSESSLALATDGGMLDTSAITTLVRGGVKNIIQFWVNDRPFVEVPSISYLFGVGCCSPWLCQNPAAALGPGALQLFDSSRWPEAQAALGRQTGPGFVHLKDVQVINNPTMGVTPYVVRNLIIFSNTNLEQFGAYMDNWEDIRAALGPQVGGSLPSHVARGRAPFVSGWPALYDTPTPFNSTAKCLLAQYKLKMAEDVLLKVLRPALK